MFKLYYRIVSILYLQCNQALNIFAFKPDLIQLMGYHQSSNWPLQAGYPGLAITNLNEYVSLFSHCRVNIQNYQGIEIIGVKSPVYLTRYDVANLEFCRRIILGVFPRHPIFSPNIGKHTHRFLFGKIPPKSTQNCSIDYSQFVHISDKPLATRWYCTAQLDLFFPEPKDAPHIVKHSQRSQEEYLFDIGHYMAAKNKDYIHNNDIWSK